MSRRSTKEARRARQRRAQLISPQEHARRQAALKEAATPHLTPPPLIKLLRVQTDYFVAGAVFRRLDNAWTCLRAAPILRWMTHRPVDQIAANLLKMGARCDWLPLSVTASKICQGGRA